MYYAEYMTRYGKVIHLPGSFANEFDAIERVNQLNAEYPGLGGYFFVSTDLGDVVF